MNLFASSTPEFIDLSRKFTELKIENTKLKVELKEEREKHKYAALAAEAEAREVNRLNEQLKQALKELDHIKQVEFPRRVELVAKGWREKVSRLESELEERKLLQGQNNEDQIALAGRKFSLSKTGDFIQDEKFDFDAGFKLSGDFVSEDQQRAYAKMIVDALNEATRSATR